MKKLTSYLLLLFYLPVSFNFFIPVAAYKLNQKLIAEELCENRDKPEMMCNGKCYLVKQMEKQTGTKNDSDNEIILTNIYEMPHLMVSENKSFDHFPRIFSFYSFYKNPVNLYLDVRTPPPKPG
jgi:hypothetical protein